MRLRRVGPRKRASRSSPLAAVVYKVPQHREEVQLDGRLHILLINYLYYLTVRIFPIQNVPETCVDAMEGAVRRGRTHALCVAAQGWGEHGFAVPRVRHLPGYRIQNL